MPNKKRNHLKSGVKHLPLSRVYPFNAADIRRQVMIEILNSFHHKKSCHRGRSFDILLLSLPYYIEFYLFRLYHKGSENSIDGKMLWNLLSFKYL